MIGSKQQLAVLLSKLKPFEAPDPELEQYPTDSEVAAEILWTAFMSGEIEGKRVADLGCGTGILGIGALVLGASHVALVELDPRVFPILMENLALVEQLTKEEFANYDIIQGNVDAYDEPADTVLQNPPFGTRDRGADVAFLTTAMRLASIVYSLHKTSTEDHLQQVVRAEGGVVTATWRYAFPLKRTMAHHEKRIERIEVTCLKIVK